MIILGSARPDGETRRAVELALGGKAEVIILPHLHIGGFGHGNDGDDFRNVVEKMLAHQRIVFATPIYWFAMSGVLKTFLDRMSDVVEIAKPAGRTLAEKELWVIATGTDEFLPDGFEIPFRGIARYFSMTYRGCAYLYTGAEGDLRQASEAALAAYGATI